MSGLNKTRSKAGGDFDPEGFQASGYQVVRGFWSPDACAEVKAAVLADLNPVIAPAEYEADVGYPGAPADRLVEGGNTPRRLLNAYARYPAIRPLVMNKQVATGLASLGNRADDPSSWCLSQCHHNCVMTKYPGYSSATAWHQDIRYWSFDRPQLISMWVALGEETQVNGALRVIPGSHQMTSAPGDESSWSLELERGRLDRDLFLRPELAENQALIDQAVVVELQAGDALFFHCRLFHAAGRNSSDSVKLSAVFTYHEANNQPIPGTRSALHPAIALQQGVGLE